ncbi:MAG: universal stress protein [Proteobacteria bacterium]|nr:universal stress protein [Pseudomonadota bacterium]MBU4381509.1 universal stress protein [Pseudomonadota bacterium]MCG2766496.1 universal stress protein [Desulfarculaceae bacterium]
MRILVALDQDMRSAHTLSQVTQLLVNTWANVTLLGIVPRKSDDGGVPMDFVDTMNQYHKAVLQGFAAEDLPYAPADDDYEIAEIRPGIYEKIGNTHGGIKELTVRIRVGNPTQTILEEAQDCGSDLIVLHGDMDSQQKIATKADCSVLIVKKERDTGRILCFLDDDLLSQRSLEMITQMAVLFNAEIEIAGLTDKQSVEEKIEKKLDWLIHYFNGKGIQPWIQLVALSYLEPFILEQDHWSLVTMWMGETSIFKRLFSVNKVAKLLESRKSSVLLLR